MSSVVDKLTDKMFGQMYKIVKRAMSKIMKGKTEEGISLLQQLTEEMERLMYDNED